MSRRGGYPSGPRPEGEPPMVQAWIKAAQDEQERGATWSSAYHEVARSEAAKALKRAFPMLCEDFTDQWFEKVVDIVLTTHREWSEK